MGIMFKTLDKLLFEFTLAVAAQEQISSHRHWGADSRIQSKKEQKYKEKSLTMLKTKMKI